MRTDRSTRCLLLVIAGLLAVMAFRDSSPPAGVAAAAAAQQQQPPPREGGGPAVPAAVAGDLAALQVSSAPGGVLVFDGRTGEIFIIPAAKEPAVQPLGALRRDAGGRWEFVHAGGNARADAARVTAAHADLAVLKTALDAYRADTGRFPASEEGLQALVVQPGGADNWRGPYFRRGGGVPKDPWGNPYIYQFPGRADPTGPDLRSFGPDRRDGGGDDIVGE